MSWRDRDYNRGSSSFNDFFANPGSILALSIPFGTWFGARVRLHFWLLLSILFIYIDGFRFLGMQVASLMTALTIVALLGHEFGHRIAATLVGGDHDEFMLWPAGGLIPPNAPPRPLATFIAHAGGIAANLILAAATVIALRAMHWLNASILTHPWQLFFGGLSSIGLTGGLLQQALAIFLALNISLIFANTVVFIYWFDAAYLLQALLWPWLGLYKAINITCIVGMIETAGLFVLALSRGDLFGMIITALMFSSSYTKRRALRAAGPEEFQNLLADSAAYSNRPPRRRLRKSWFKTARRRVNKEQAEQARIDAILAKVHDHGLHSLSFWEKRTLRKATARQRERDLAERL